MQQTFAFNKGFYSRSFFICALTIIICVVSMVFTGDPDTTGKSVLFIVFCLIGSPSLLRFIYISWLLMSKKIPLTMDAQGIHDQCNGSNSGHIRWHNVHSIQGTEDGKYKYIVLGITDVRPLVEQYDVAGRMAFEKKLERSKHHVIILLNQLKGNPSEIYYAIEQEWKNATGRE